MKSEATAAAERIKNLSFGNERFDLTTNFEKIIQAAIDAELTELRSQLTATERERGEAKAEGVWIREKLGLAADVPFASGKGPTLAGTMHVVCSHAHGYETYIVSHKCDDKQGEIARLTVELAEAKRLFDEARWKASDYAEQASRLQSQLAASQAEAERMREELAQLKTPHRYTDEERSYDDPSDFLDHCDLGPGDGFFLEAWRSLGDISFDVIFDDHDRLIAVPRTPAALAEGKGDTQ